MIARNRRVAFQLRTNPLPLNQRPGVVDDALEEVFISDGGLRDFRHLNDTVAVVIEYSKTKLFLVVPHLSNAAKGRERTFYCRFDVCDFFVRQHPTPQSGLSSECCTFERQPQAT